MAQQTITSQGLLILGVSWSHSDTPQSVGILWTSDQPDTGTLFDNTYHSQETNIHALGWIRTRSPSKRGRKPKTARASGIGLIICVLR
jgi:hypothetical protein